VRGQMHTGRPLGAEEFVATLEQFPGQDARWAENRTQATAATSCQMAEPVTPGPRAGIRLVSAALWARVAVSRRFRWASSVEAIYAAGATLAPIPRQGDLGREEDIKLLRAREHTSQPLGGEEFLATLEQNVGRILNGRKPGPKPRRRRTVKRQSPRPEPCSGIRQAVRGTRTLRLGLMPRLGCGTALGFGGPIVELPCAFAAFAPRSPSRGSLRDPGALMCNAFGIPVVGGASSCSPL
jgi:hypothetical protein